MKGMCGVTLELNDWPIRVVSEGRHANRALALEQRHNVVTHLLNEPCHTRSPLLLACPMILDCPPPARSGDVLSLEIAFVNTSFAQHGARVQL